MEKDLITIIVPAYNHGLYIREAIESLIAQTYKNLELLIVDDGSKDNTMDVLETLVPQCKKRFVNFSYKTQPNMGTVDTFNQLIDMAQGDYIYLIASDDLAKPEAIATLHEYISKHPECALVVGDNELIGSDSKRIGWGVKRELVPVKNAKYKTFADYLKEKHQYVDFKSDDFGSYESLLRSNYIPNGYLMRRTALLAVGRYKKGFVEDWYLNLQLARHYKMHYIDKVLFSYRWHDFNSIKTLFKQDKMSKIAEALLKHEKKFALENGYEKEWKKLYNKRLKKKISKWLFTFKWGKKGKEIRLFGLNLVKKQPNLS